MEEVDKKLHGEQRRGIRVGWSSHRNSTRRRQGRRTVAGIRYKTRRLVRHEEREKDVRARSGPKGLQAQDKMLKQEGNALETNENAREGQKYTKKTESSKKNDEEMVKRREEGRG